MDNRVLALIREYDMLCPGDRVFCALSGGADSVALLWALYLLRDKLELQLDAAHFNHQLRGEESDRDEAFVRSLCRHYDIPLTVGRGCITAGEKGLEAAAREARYAFFDTLPGKVATAHTADDNTETVLMHLVRGTGLKGLGGIAPVRGKYIRPMLTVTRRDVENFLEEYHLSHIHDSSNDTDAFLRNRLRRQVLPLLLRENPRLMENTSAMALRLRRDEEALTPELPIGDELPVQALLALPEPMQTRLLTAFLAHHGLQDPTAGHIALLRQLALSQNPSARASFPGGLILCRCYDQILRLDGSPALPGRRLCCREADALENTPSCFTVVPQGQLTVRSRRSGDSIRLPGGTRSLKKLFIDRKIPAHRRDDIPVLADDAGVLGVFGIGVNLDRAAQALPAITVTLEEEKYGK